MPEIPTPFPNGTLSWPGRELAIQGLLIPYTWASLVSLPCHSSRTTTTFSSNVLRCPSRSFSFRFFNLSFGVPELLLLLIFYVFVQCQKSRKTINVSFLLCRIFYAVISLLSIPKPPLTVFPLSQAPCYKLRIDFVHKRWKYWRLQRFSVKGNG